MGETLKGAGVSGGVARGPAHVLLTTRHVAAERRSIAEAEVPRELQRFEEALQRAEDELKSLQHSLAGQLGSREIEIFGAQALLVRSSEWVEPVRTLVRDECVNVEAALTHNLKRLLRTFESIADPYIRERAADIRDVGKRVLSALAAHAQDDNAGVPPGAIVVAEELLPSLTARLELQRVGALVTERGGRSSHASILARAQGIAFDAGSAGSDGRGALRSALGVSRCTLACFDSSNGWPAGRRTQAESSPSAERWPAIRWPRPCCWGWA